MIDIATGEVDDAVSEGKRHPESVRGRAGGKKGGRARAKHLTAARRSDIARVAAGARWKKK
jgi:hypothetical protein